MTRGRTVVKRRRGRTWRRQLGKRWSFPDNTWKKRMAKYRLESWSAIARVLLSVSITFTHDIDFQPWGIRLTDLPSVSYILQLNPHTQREHQKSYAARTTGNADEIRMRFSLAIIFGCYSPLAIWVDKKTSQIYTLMLLHDRLTCLTARSHLVHWNRIGIGLVLEMEWMERNEKEFLLLFFCFVWFLKLGKWNRHEGKIGLGYSCN